MRKIFNFLLITTLVLTACGSSAGKFFSKKTPHEKYADKHEETPEGRAWLAAGKQSLEYPVEIELPYRQQGYFQPGKPRALSLEFSAKAGERISFDLDKKITTGQVMYIDLFRKGSLSDNPLYSAAPGDSTFVFDVEDKGEYILRVQPEIGYHAKYELNISSGASLAFPVAGNKAKTGSFWGASRDGGKRSHEGIDIFAPKRTPVIASADGYVTGVHEGGLGGKVVWQRVSGKNITLYYAHLDKQMVSEGQSVQKGDTIGLVGNTGNAKHTPSHLHFGIYSFSGPIDPFPFVNPAVKKAPLLAKKELSSELKLEKTLKLSNGTALTANTKLIPVAVNAKGYIAELPDGNMMLVNFSVVKGS